VAACRVRPRSPSRSTICSSDGIGSPASSTTAGSATIRPTQFNYPVDILGRWHGTKYRFIQRYRSGFPENLGEEFDAPFARLDWISRNRFDLQWHRQTGEWFCLHRSLTLADAIDTLQSEALFHPF
jgi:hypothetical protein